MKKVNFISIVGSIFCISDIASMNPDGSPHISKPAKTFSQMQEKRIQKVDALLNDINFDMFRDGFLKEGLTEEFLKFINKINENVLIGQGFAVLRYYRRELVKKTIDSIPSNSKPAGDFIQKVSLACYFVGDLFRLCDDDSLFKKYLFPLLKRQHRTRTIRGIDQRIINSWMGTYEFLSNYLKLNDAPELNDAKEGIWFHLYHNGLLSGSRIPKP
jgi:hypothetical protein